MLNGGTRQGVIGSEKPFDDFFAAETLIVQEGDGAGQVRYHVTVEEKTGGDLANSTLAHPHVYQSAVFHHAMHAAHGNIEEFCHIRQGQPLPHKSLDVLSAVLGNTHATTVIHASVPRGISRMSRPGPRARDH